MGQLLEDIRSHVDIDEEELVGAFLREHSKSVDTLLNRIAFAREGMPQVVVKCYATEVATQLYLEFAMTYQCSDTTGQGRSNAVLALRGDGCFDTGTREYLKLRNHGEKLMYNDAEGQQKVENVVIMAGTAVLGHRSVHHAVKYELP